MPIYQLTSQELPIISIYKEVRYWQKYIPPVINWPGHDANVAKSEKLYNGKYLLIGDSLNIYYKPVSSKPCDLQKHEGTTSL